MAKGMRYDDAVKLLGVGQSKAVAAIDAILGGALLGTAVMAGSFEVVGLFDAKSELVKHGHSLVAKLGQRARGVRGQSRMDLLSAAHTVLVLTGFFESLPIMASKGSTLADQLREARIVEVRNRRQFADGLLRTEVPVPLPSLTQDMNRDQVRRYYESLSREVRSYFTALEGHAGSGTPLQHHLDGAVKADIVADAMRRYDEHFLALCRDCPEFALWSIFREHSAGRSELRDLLQQNLGELSTQLDTALDGLRTALGALVSNAVPADWSERLSRHYRPVLVAPIADVGGDRSLTGLRVPTLERAYINPSCRVAVVESAASVATDSWWGDQRLVDDVEVFLTAHLTSPAATDAPLVVLGQPGSGKSVLSKILVAGLPSGDFLPVRVELRQVPAEDSVQDHIERTVRDATGSAVEWPELVAAAGGALPLVILDGFDELLQSTRVTQSNYLEQIQKFQRREARQGRPVAVVVTSRTVVADRVRYPEGTVAVRLEPFQPVQIARWLEVWNENNAAYLALRELRPLTSADLARHGELASQPLLLLMLALYDADGNRLSREGTVLDETELYERLLDRFVRREVSKNPLLDTNAVEREVVRELHRLSIVAFAMFNRGRVYAHDDEIDADLLALLGHEQSSPPGGRFGRAFTDGELMVGRFFFVHESVATRGPENRASTYEFLHATFGEYLVARLAARLVADLTKRMAGADEGLYPAAPDDSWLHAMLSWKPLTGRSQIVTFLMASLAEAEPHSRELLLRLFRSPMAGPRPANLAAYRPASGPSVAIYQINLLVLLLCLRDAHCSDLFPGDPDPVRAWQSAAHRWRAWCDWPNWTDLIRNVRVDKERTPLGRDLRIRLASDRSAVPDAHYDAEWWSAGQGLDPSEQWIAFHNAFLCDAGNDRLLHTMAGMNTAYASSLRSGRGGRTLARGLVELLLNDTGSAERAQCYADVVDVLDWRGEEKLLEDGPDLQLLIHELRLDLRRDPARFLAVAADINKRAYGARNADVEIALATLLLEEIAVFQDATPVLRQVYACLLGLIPATVGGASRHSAYLRMWLAHLDAGLDPVTFDSRWESSEMLLKIDLAELAVTDPGLLVRLVRSVARTGVRGGPLAPRIAAALPKLPVGALNQLTEREVSVVGGYASKAAAQRGVKAWRNACKQMTAARLAAESGDDAVWADIIDLAEDRDEKLDRDGGPGVGQESPAQAG